MKLLAFLRNEKGQDLIEYTLILAFLALASAAIVLSAQGGISAMWSSASSQLSKAATAGS